MYTLGFIGVGHMGGALAQAAAKVLPASELVLANRTAEKAQRFAQALGCQAADNVFVASNCRYIMLGVKPQMMEALLESLRPVLEAREEKPVLVSMAAGLTTARISQMAGGLCPVIRIMPNTPCAIGKGVVLTCRSRDVADEDYAEFKTFLAQAGLVTDLDEKLMDAGCAISGCGPAFVYTFIEAMSDAGVACGLTRADARILAAATVMGSADMVLQTGEHPASLRDSVCSPGGSTIAGVLSLENDGFRAAVANCVEAAYTRTQELGK